jgi:hypothetical protein
MTLFPYPTASGEFDRAAFVDDFEQIFSGSITACIAIKTPIPDPLEFKGAYGVQCGDRKDDIVLIFQQTNGSWRFTHGQPWEYTNKLRPLPE